MNVEEFKKNIQKKYFGLKIFFMKKIWWEKNWDDINWLSTLKKHSQFESCEIFKILNLKVY
jgi:hypothetical protein